MTVSRGDDARVYPSEMRQPDLSAVHGLEYGESPRSVIAALQKQLVEKDTMIADLIRMAEVLTVDYEKMKRGSSDAGARDGELQRVEEELREERETNAALTQRLAKAEEAVRRVKDALVKWEEQKTRRDGQLDGLQSKLAAAQARLADLQKVEAPSLEESVRTEHELWAQRRATEEAKGQVADLKKRLEDLELEVELYRAVSSRPNSDSEQQRKGGIESFLTQSRRDSKMSSSNQLPPMAAAANDCASIDSRSAASPSEGGQPCDRRSASCSRRAVSV
ncbi:hypothetical protein DIPPA_11610 [Diplonema papillatum]|nr:hypothetical protein DIPPA_11610 [Diplonema papillatum]KAJ9469168.1 hypothetical protein DIPPA_11610 [Diplonema papillatum]KAJ9469169.1 hypothetical protein DIPPA_11610 [Diplonema papillatum]